MTDDAPVPHVSPQTQCFCLRNGHKAGDRAQWCQLCSTTDFKGFSSQFCFSTSHCPRQDCRLLRGWLAGMSESLHIQAGSPGRKPHSLHGASDPAAPRSPDIPRVSPFAQQLALPCWQPGGRTALQRLARSRQGSLRPGRAGPVCRIRLSTVVKGPRTSEGCKVLSLWGRIGEPLGGDSGWGSTGGQAGQVSSSFSFHRPDRQRVSSWRHPSEGSVDLPRRVLGLGSQQGPGMDVVRPLLTAQC